MRVEGFEGYRGIGGRKGVDCADLVTLQKKSGVTGCEKGPEARGSMTFSVGAAHR